MRWGEGDWGWGSTWIKCSTCKSSALFIVIALAQIDLVNKILNPNPSSKLDPEDWGIQADSSEYLLCVDALTSQSFNTSSSK